VVLVACKREIVEDYQLVLSDAGLTARVVDCAVFALENAAEITEEHGVPEGVELLAPEDAEVHALVNIGANLININVQINGQMAFVRDQFYGGQNLTEEIQREYNLGYHEAEKMKVENIGEVGEEALERWYAGLTSELVRSLDFYAANHAEYPVQKILLSGGSALVPGIAAEIEQRIGIDASVLNPFPDAIKASPRRFDAEYLQNVGPMLMVPIGLALRSFDT